MMENWSRTHFFSNSTNQVSSSTLGNTVTTEMPIGSSSDNTQRTRMFENSETDSQPTETENLSLFTNAVGNSFSVSENTNKFSSLKIEPSRSSQTPATLTTQRPMFDTTSNENTPSLNTGISEFSAIQTTLSPSRTKNNEITLSSSTSASFNSESVTDKTTQFTKSISFSSSTFVDSEQTSSTTDFVHSSLTTRRLFKETQASTVQSSSDTSRSDLLSTITGSSRFDRTDVTMSVSGSEYGLSSTVFTLDSETADTVTSQSVNPISTVQRLDTIDLTQSDKTTVDPKDSTQFSTTTINTSVLSDQTTVNQEMTSIGLTQSDQTTAPTYITSPEFLSTETGPTSMASEMSTTKFTQSDQTSVAKLDFSRSSEVTTESILESTPIEFSTNTDFSSQTKSFTTDSSSNKPLISEKITFSVSTETNKPSTSLNTFSSLVSQLSTGSQTKFLSTINRVDKASLAPSTASVLFRGTTKSVSKQIDVSTPVNLFTSMSFPIKLNMDNSTSVFQSTSLPTKKESTTVTDALTAKLLNRNQTATDGIKQIVLSTTESTAVQENITRITNVSSLPANVTDTTVVTMTTSRRDFRFTENNIIVLELTIRITLNFSQADIVLNSRLVNLIEARLIQIYEPFERNGILRIFVSEVRSDIIGEVTCTIVIETISRLTARQRSLVVQLLQDDIARRMFSFIVNDEVQEVPSPLILVLRGITSSQQTRRESYNQPCDYFNALGICLNGANCRIQPGNIPVCRCVPGFTGDTCADVDDMRSLIIPLATVGALVVIAVLVMTCILLSFRVRKWSRGYREVNRGESKQNDSGIASIGQPENFTRSIYLPPTAFNYEVPKPPAIQAPRQNQDKQWSWRTS